MTEAKTFIIEIEEARYARLYKPKSPPGGASGSMFGLSFHHKNMPDDLLDMFEDQIIKSEERDGNGKSLLFAGSKNQPVIVPAKEVRGTGATLENIYWKAESSRIPMDVLISDTPVRINVRPFKADGFRVGEKQASLLLIAVEVDIFALDARLKQLREAIMRASDTEDLI